MKKFFLFFLTLFVLGFVSCDNKCDDVLSVEEKIYLPVKFGGPGYFEIYSYDDQNRLSEVNKKSVINSFEMVYTLNYDGDLLTSVHIDYSSASEVGGYAYVGDYTLEYVGNKLEVTYVFLDNMDYSMQEFNVFNFDEKGRILSGNGLIVEHDDRGNLIKLESAARRLYGEYDSKNGIFKNLNVSEVVLFAVFDFAHFYLANNPVYFENEDRSKVHDTLLTSKLTYEYNVDGYPVFFSSEESDGDIINTTVEYKIVESKK